MLDLHQFLGSADNRSFDTPYCIDILSDSPNPSIENMEEDRDVHCLVDTLGREALLRQTNKSMDVPISSHSLFATAGKEHSTVYFRSKRNKVDKRVRLAPTPWKEIGEVNLADPRIQWFSYDEKESRKVIPIDQLWK